MDHWFEKYEEVYVHPRDPYKRIDVLASSRHVKMEIEGQTVADSNRPTLLLETNLPLRYYLPLQDVHMELLKSSDTITRCPYKGEAHYFSVRLEDRLVEDIAWQYSYPTSEAKGIESHLCFYNERVDTYVDGELRDRPQTRFSPR